MSSRGSAGDASALLFLVPFAASGAYALYLWVRSGVSAFLPDTVYLTVTRDPILFVVGSVAVLLGIVIEVNSTDRPGRGARLASLSGTLQTMAAASLVLVLLSAFYANGFGDVSGAATDFLVGRYGVLFPAILVLLSYLIRAQFRLEALRNTKVLGIISLLLVPAVVYELGRRQILAGLSLALLLLVLGLLPFLLPGRKPEAAAKPGTAP